MVPYVHGLSFDIPLLQNIDSAHTCSVCLDIPSVCCNMKSCYFCGSIVFEMSVTSGCYQTPRWSPSFITRIISAFYIGIFSKYFRNAWTYYLLKLINLSYVRNCCC